MDWNTNENNNDENDISNSSIHHHDEFSNLNTNNYDTNLNLNLNQLSQLISLNSSNNNPNTIELLSNPNSSNLVKNDFDDNDDKSSTIAALLLMNKNDLGLNTHETNLFSIPINVSSSDTMFLSDITSSSHLHQQFQQLTQNLSLQDQQQEHEDSLKKLYQNRFNYKCNHCFHLTKFKAHIIEHMQAEHKINLMQCPYSNCLKNFKDEWKLKRHLASNKEHVEQGTFKDLNDCIKQHVFVTPQKIGQYPCPLCQIDQLTGDILVLNEHAQQTLIQNLINRNIDNSLYFDKYEDLKDHILANHATFNIDSYFVCKQCGQVFLNRYKLSCHQFNVHSGKRKRRAKTTNQIDTQININQMLNTSLISLVSDQANNGSDNITSVIDSVAKGFGQIEQNSNTQTNVQSNQSLLITDRKYLCIICTRKFKRVRDLETHVHIMHKGINEEQKEQIKCEIEKTSLMLKTKIKNKTEFMSLTNEISYTPINNLASSDLNTKICFICNKVFRGALSSSSTSPGITNTLNLNKSFQRHLQLQHGINEKGERLIDCPVCEKCFFSRIQLERHMRTHQVWIEHLHQTHLHQHENKQNDLIEIDKLTGLVIPEFRDKHSILYCHECVECSIYFKSIKVLTRHKKDVHSLKPVYKCANTIDCNRQFDTIEQFLEHSKLHTQKNIICGKCKIKFNTKNSLRHHMKNVHYKVSITTRRPTTTAINSTISRSSSSSLKNKIQTFSPLAQPQPQPQPCKILNLIDLRNQQQQHETPSNTNELKSDFLCPTCGQDFPSRNSLHNHLATHNTNDLKLFMCTHCPVSFKTRKELSRHVGSHDFTKHKTCQECGETFKTSFHLKRHSLTRHSNIRPFKCNHCEMTFARKDKLKQHEAKHINHPLYKCNDCGKGFYRKEHLKDHEISKHSKQYPFSCENCNKGFVHAKDLHRHIRVRHLGNNSAETKLGVSSQSLIGESQTMSSNSMTSNLVIVNKQDQIVNTQNSGAKTRQMNKVQNILSTAGNSVKNFTTTTAGSTPNDFKSKKISSILKSNLFMSNFCQSETLNSKSTPTNLISNQNTVNLDPKPVVLNTANCQLISVKLNDLNLIFDKLNNSNTKIKDQLFILDQNNQELKPQVEQQIVQLTNIETLPRQDQDQEEVEAGTQYSFLKSFKCNHCDQSFFYENLLKKHLTNKHSTAQIYSCSYCNKGFTASSTAKSHVENSHVDYECPVCAKSFKNKSHAQRHIDKFHLNTNQNLMPLRQAKINAHVIDSSVIDTNNASINLESLNGNSINNNNNGYTGTILIQSFENFNNLQDLNNNNLNLVNFNFDRQHQNVNYSNLNWSAMSTPSTSSTSPISSSVSQSPLGSNNNNHASNMNTFYNLNNQQQSLADSLNNQTSFFL